jgi:hypothetical protein
MIHAIFRNLTFVAAAVLLELAAVAAPAVGPEPFPCIDGSFIVQDVSCVGGSGP